MTPTSGAYQRERDRSIVGTPQSVVARMVELQELFAVDEAIVLTVAASYRARLRSCELLAEAFELDRAQRSTGLHHEDRK